MNLSKLFYGLYSMVYDKLKQLGIGAYAGVVSRTLTAPLDLYKLQLQNPFMPSKNLYDVVQREGYRHLWKGNFSNCVRIIPHQAINYMTYQSAFSTTHQSFLSGIISGVVSTTATYPLETLRVRLALQDYNTHYKGIWNALRTTSMRELYRGSAICLIGFPLFNAISFSVHSSFDTKPKNILTEIAQGGIAGSAAITLTYPTDLLRRRMQLQGFDAAVPNYSSILNAVKTIYSETGIHGFYRGLGVCYVKIFPATGIYFYLVRKTG